MSKSRQAFVVYWEQDGSTTSIDWLSENTPKEVKRMIAERLLQELGINIIINPTKP